MRGLNYGLAINEAFLQLMTEDPTVFLMGQGVNSPWYVGNTTKDLLQRFGNTRVIDTPVSENGVTGAALGAALAGMRPVVIHPRIDFALLAFEEIINQAANWHYMFGGVVSAPLTVRCIINRGGQQGCQHSQALHAMFMHVPGLKLVAPSTAYDAKGLMVASIRDPNPVIYIDDRWLYTQESDVPEEIYSVPIGKGIVRRRGKDVTIVGVSFMAREAEKAADALALEGVDAEVIDPRSLKPFDEELIVESVSKTGRLVIADTGWTTCGVASEISARVTEKCFKYLKAAPWRVALPDLPAPMSGPLEDAYYRDSRHIVDAVMRIIK